MRRSKIGHNPFFTALRKALRLAAHSHQKGAPPADEIAEWARDAQQKAYSRREFLSLTAGATAMAGLAACNRPDPKPQPTSGPKTSEVAKIAIVGGGIAGLHAAYVLQKAGVASTIYEGSGRAGGRIYTGSDVVAPNTYTELGGEFIDTNHEDMIQLCKEFGLKLNDRLDPKGEGKLNEAYFFEGKLYTETQLITAFKPVAKRMLVDIDKISDTLAYNTMTDDDKHFDQMSIAQYLDSIGCSGWIRKLLDVAWVTEFGLETDQQTALNLLWMIGADLSEGFSMFGESDEKYEIDGGNEQVVKELHKRLGAQVKLEHKLMAIQDHSGGGYTLVFSHGNGTKEVKAEMAIIAIPFTLLREVDIQASLPPLKKKAIAELGYGTNAKLFVGFNNRVWRQKGYSGESFSDVGYQLMWDHTAFQPMPAGGLTLFSGGKDGVATGTGSAQEHVARLMQGVDQVFPGSKAAQNGQVAQFHWPTYAWAKASYACYKPGQYTAFSGMEFEPVGNMHFAGEHCSADYQGYMNGGAETGRRAAEAILGKLGKPIS